MPAPYDGIGFDSLPQELLTAVMLLLDAGKDAHGLLLASREALQTWRVVARPLWVQAHRTAQQMDGAFRHACSSNNAEAVACMLGLGWPGAASSAAAELHRHMRFGQPRAAVAIVDWAARAAPGLLVPPSGANGPLVLAAASGCSTVACYIADALLQMLAAQTAITHVDASGSCREAAVAVARHGMPTAVDVQLQLDRALRAAAAGGHVCIMSHLLHLGARNHGACCSGDGSCVVGGICGLQCSALEAAVLNCQREAVALLVSQHHAAGVPSALQLALAAELSASLGYARCLSPLLESTAISAQSLSTVLLAAARAGQPQCASLIIGRLRRHAVHRRQRSAAAEAAASAAAHTASDAVCCIVKVVAGDLGEGRRHGDGTKAAHDRLCVAPLTHGTPASPAALMLQCALQDALSVVAAGSPTATLLEREVASVADWCGGSALLSTCHMEASSSSAIARGASSQSMLPAGGWWSRLMAALRHLAE